MQAAWPGAPTLWRCCSALASFGCVQGDTGKLIWKEDPGAGAGEKPGRGGNLTIAESTKQMSTKRKEEASEMARGLR